MIKDGSLRKNILSYLFSYAKDAGDEYDSKLNFVSERLNDTLDGSTIELDGKTLHYVNSETTVNGIKLIYSTSDKLFEPVEIEIKTEEDFEKYFK